MGDKIQRADYEKRFAAALIDHIVLCVVSSIGVPFLYLEVYSNGFDRRWIFFPMFMCIVFFVYYFKDIVGGASIGKRVMGLTVRNCDESAMKPSAKKLFARNIFSFLWPVELLMILLGKHKRKIGDILAGTDVYRAYKTA